MRSVRGLAVLIGAATLALGGMSAANASPPSLGGCSGGPVSGGSYSNYSVTGNCYLGDGVQLVVRGNVTIAPGARLDATRYPTSSLTIGGNVTAGRGAVFAIGCTQAHPCSPTGDPMDATGPKPTGADSVGGNVALNGVYNAALNGVSIGGNLTSAGGGAGLIPQTGPDSPFIPFSVKDDVIHGNVTVIGLRTVWFGIIRSHVGGNVTVINNSGTAIGETGPDSNEVVANTIGGNLVCLNNSPTARFGDAILEAPYPGYGPNQVRGNVVGECRALV